MVRMVKLSVNVFRITTFSFFFWYFFYMAHWLTLCPNSLIVPVNALTITFKNLEKQLL